MFSRVFSYGINRADFRHLDDGATLPSRESTMNAHPSEHISDEISSRELHVICDSTMRICSFTKSAMYFRFSFTRK